MRRPSLNIAGLYAILDLPHRRGHDPESVVAAMLAGGAGVVQLRSKQAPLDPALVEALGARCATANVPMIINDELELACRGIVGVAGVHLGQGDLDRLGVDLSTRQRRRAELRVRGVGLGVSTHNLDQLQAVTELEPDYVGFGPVFSTTSKVDHDPVVGLEQLSIACARSLVPVVAIGGIELARVAELRATGVAAIAVIGALLGDTVEIIRARSFALSRAMID